MAEGQPVLGQQRLRLGTTKPGLERRGHRDGVDGEEPVHPQQVEADHSGEAVAHRSESAGHRGAAAEGHHRDVVPDRDAQHGFDVVGGAGADDHVGGVRQVAGPGAQQVGGRLATGAQASGRVVGDDVGVADRLRSSARRPVQARAGRATILDRRAVVTPNASSTSARADSGRAVAAAGSPQRVGCISGVARVFVRVAVTV